VRAQRDITEVGLDVGEVTEQLQQADPERGPVAPVMPTISRMRVSWFVCSASSYTN
jgi:hypothetical protein